MARSYVHGIGEFGCVLLWGGVQSSWFVALLSMEEVYNIMLHNTSCGCMYFTSLEKVNLIVDLQPVQIILPF